MGEGSLVRVCVDSPLPHLDRLFDYSVPEALAPLVDVGTRVRVPFHGRLVNGIVCELGSAGDYAGRIQEIHSAGAVPSTTRAGVDLVRLVARRYGGSLWDVLRLAVPPRVASVERRWVGKAEGTEEGVRARISSAASATPGESPLSALGGRVVWEAAPAAERSSLPVEAVLGLVIEAAQGASAIVVVPDSRALAVLAQRLRAVGLSRWTSRSGGDFAIVHTEDGPSVRYENYLAALHGAAPIILGTRSTVFQPVPSLGLLLLWGEGNSAYQDPHAPYPHARTVAAIRTEVERSRLILGAWSPSVEAAALVEHGWASYASASREAVRESAPTIEVLTEARRSQEGPQGWHWMPGAAWRALTVGLLAGPVFVLVPRAGYVTALACSRCGQWARCSTCGGQLSLGRRGAPPTCGECGARSPHWHCPDCRSDRLSETRQGVERIAEQVRRMAPEVAVSVSSTVTGILDDGAVRGGIVVATPGSLPAVPEGYAAGVIIGADTGLGRARTEVDAAGLWFGAAALVRSRKAGGRMVVVGDVEPNVRRALEAWTPGDLAKDVARERATLGLPPFRRVVRVEGSEDLLGQVMALTVEGTRLDAHAEIAVVPSPTGFRTLLCARRIAQEVVDSLRKLQREWSEEGWGEIRLRVDGPLGPSA